MDRHRPWWRRRRTTPGGGGRPPRGTLLVVTDLHRDFTGAGPMAAEGADAQAHALAVVTGAILDARAGGPGAPPYRNVEVVVEGSQWGPRSSPDPGCGLPAHGSGVAYRDLAVGRWVSPADCFTWPRCPGCGADPLLALADGKGSTFPMAPTLGRYERVHVAGLSAEHGAVPLAAAIAATGQPVTLLAGDSTWLAPAELDSHVARLTALGVEVPLAPALPSPAALAALPRARPPVTPRGRLLVVTDLHTEFAPGGPMAAPGTTPERVTALVDAVRSLAGGEQRRARGGPHRDCVVVVEAADWGDGRPAGEGSCGLPDHGHATGPLDLAGGLLLAGPSRFSWDRCPACGGDPRAGRAEELGGSFPLGDVAPGFEEIDVAGLSAEHGAVPLARALAGTGPAVRLLAGDSTWLDPGGRAAIEAEVAGLGVEVVPAPQLGA